MTVDNLQFQGMPLQSTPLMNPDGTVQIAWYRFFVSLYKRSGLETPNFAVTGPDVVDGSLVPRVYPQFYATDPNSGSSKVLVLRDQNDGSLIGLITYTP